MSGAQAGDHQALFGFGRRGLFDHGIDAIEVLAAGYALAARRAVMRQQVLAGGLHGRNGAGLGFGDFDQLLRAAFSVRLM